MLIIGSNLGKLPNVVISIFSDAFTGQAIAGGALGVVIMTGIRRAAFSNEAGMGTEAMAHGAARTNEPTSEGLVAMIGPVIDTLVLCSLTALVILVTDVSLNQDTTGILITKEAFAKGIPNNTWIGPSLLLVSVLFLSYSSMLGFSYYVLKCGAFLFGEKSRHPILVFYLLSIVISSAVKLKDAINFLDIAFGLMAIPTIISATILAPKVMRMADSYFAKLRK
jgi:AGCS family alanine or glycine:cation symporter